MCTTCLQQEFGIFPLKAILNKTGFFNKPTKLHFNNKSNRITSITFQLASHIRNKWDTQVSVASIIIIIDSICDELCVVRKIKGHTVQALISVENLKLWHISRADEIQNGFCFGNSIENLETIDFLVRTFGFSLRCSSSILTCKIPCSICESIDCSSNLYPTVYYSSLSVLFWNSQCNPRSAYIVEDVTLSSSKKR